MNLKYQGVPAYTDLRKVDGEIERVKVYINNYSVHEQRFRVVNKELGVKTWRSRIMLVLENDDQKLLQSLISEVVRFH